MSDWSPDMPPTSSDEYCRSCGTLIPRSGRYCPRCGAPRTSLTAAAQTYQRPVQAYPMTRPVPQKKGPSWRRVGKAVLGFGMVSFAAYLVIGMFTLVYGTQLVLPEIGAYSHSLKIIIATWLVEVASLSGDALVVYYLLIVAAIVASATWLFLSSARGFHKELTMRAEPRRHSALFDVCGLMFAVLFLNYVVVFLMGLFWKEPDSPIVGVETWELLFALANASVYEELITRVLMIGVPLVFVDMVRGRLQDRTYRYMLGGGFKLGGAEVALILMSAVLFGLAHFDAWGAWKVFPSAVAGVAFGYLFLRHGLAAAIVLHFGFNYLSMPIEVFSDWSELGVLLAVSLLLIAWAAMGAVFFVYYIIRMIEFYNVKLGSGERLYFEEKPDQAAQSHQAYQQAFRYVGPYQAQVPAQPDSALTTQDLREGTPGQAGASAEGSSGPGHKAFFLCPRCGFTEARWHEGRFKCLRCGGVV